MADAPRSFIYLLEHIELAKRRIAQPWSLSTRRHMRRRAV